MSTETEVSPPAKKSYSAPKFVRYGAVSALVQFGTLPMMESAGQPQRMMGSDRRAKERVVRIGTHPLGIGLYLFDYKPGFRDTYGYGRQFGVMADEVEAVMPGAISRDLLGYKLVDYAMLGVRRLAQ
jgi:hypothetical protein